MRKGLMLHISRDGCSLLVVIIYKDDP